MADTDTNETQLIRDLTDVRNHYLALAESREDALPGEFFGEDDAFETAREFFLQWGQLLHWWPEIWDAALELRSEKA